LLTPFALEDVFKTLQDDVVDGVGMNILRWAEVVGIFTAVGASETRVKKIDPCSTFPYFLVFANICIKY
jgi:hypothetical protein